MQPGLEKKCHILSLSNLSCFHILPCTVLFNCAVLFLTHYSTSAWSFRWYAPASQACKMNGRWSDDQTCPASHTSLHCLDSMSLFNPNQIMWKLLNILANKAQPRFQPLRLKRSTVESKIFRKYVKQDGSDKQSRTTA